MGDLVDYAVSEGWWPEEERNGFDFAFAYTDFQRPLQVSQIRVQRSRELLKKAESNPRGVDVAWMKRILRDHYEDTFLEGPYFNPALPDFLTLCMHSSPAGFTWGNTASSAIFVLPQSEDHLPMLWWNPVTPCTGLYVPVFIAGGDLPPLLSKPGTAAACIEEASSPLSRSRRTSRRRTEPALFFRQCGVLPDAPFQDRARMRVAASRGTM